jgi:phage terminase large subunit-like protein
VIDLDAFDAAAEVAVADPVAAMAWSPWQEDVLRDPWRLLLVRAANQIGKTVLAAAFLVMEARGTNPFRPPRHRGPLNLMLISESLEQMSREGGVLEKLWDMLPKDEIDPGIHFERGRGLVGVKYPAITFVKGPAEGTVIRLFRYEQGPKKLEGTTLHGIVLDEPCPAAVYNAAIPRLRQHQGWLLATMTPTPDMPPQKYMQQLVAKGVVHEHHIELTEQACWPRGYARPFQTQAQIDEFVGQLEPWQVPMRVKGAWETILPDRYLTAWSDELVGDFDLRDLPEDAKVMVGVDHGIDAGKQRAHLLIGAELDTARPRFWLLDEAGSDDPTTTEQDAEAIDAMLRRNGMTIANVDIWIGDRSAQDRRAVKRKSNDRLMKAILARYGRTPDDRNAPKMDTPHKWEGSVGDGFGFMNKCMKDGRWRVHRRCTRFRYAASNWRRGQMDPLKDDLDPSRYAMQRAVNNQIRMNVSLRANY